MNGPEHYREAEKALDRLRFATLDVDEVRAEMAIAQVHATLALAAATVADRGIGPQSSSGWHAFHADPRWQEVTA